MEKKLYSLENKNGMKVWILNYGAIIQSLFVPDANGNLTDVVLGYDDFDAYEDNACFFGAAIGPVANRTEDGVYHLNGNTYQLPKNENGNNLHSDFEKGYHKCYFDVKEEAGTLICTYLDKDGDIAGSPGNKQVTITYSLTDENELGILYEVTSDQDTWVNLTNHTYFNLAGHDSGLIETHHTQILSDAITEVREGAIPTGRLLDVENTPFDFRESKRILDRIEEDVKQLQLTGGYDHNYVLRDQNTGMRFVGALSDTSSGRKMEIYTDLPGMQFYAGNFISEGLGKAGATYGKRHAVCFETQYYPNAINVESFPSAITGPEKQYTTKTIYKFV